MKWWWQKRETVRPTLDETPTVDDLAKAVRQVEEAKARLRMTAARDGRVEQAEEALRRETRIDQLGPVIARALHPKGTT